MEYSGQLTCPDCNTPLLPWRLMQHSSRVFLGRPCPRADCDYALLEELKPSKRGYTDTDEWRSDG